MNSEDTSEIQEEFPLLTPSHAMAFNRAPPQIQEFALLTSSHAMALNRAPPQQQEAPPQQQEAPPAEHSMRVHTDMLHACIMSGLQWTLTIAVMLLLYISDALKFLCSVMTGLSVEQLIQARIRDLIITGISIVITLLIRYLRILAFVQKLSSYLPSDPVTGLLLLWLFLRVVQWALRKLLSLSDEQRLWARRVSGCLGVIYMLCTMYFHVYWNQELMCERDNNFSYMVDVTFQDEVEMHAHRRDKFMLSWPNAMYSWFMCIVGLSTMFVNQRIGIALCAIGTLWMLSQQRTAVTCDLPYVNVVCNLSAAAGETGSCKK